MNEHRLRLLLRGAVALAICSPAMAVSCGGSVASVDDAGASSSSSGGSTSSSGGSSGSSGSTSSSSSSTSSSSGSSSGALDASTDACGAPASFPDADVCTYYVGIPCDYAWDGGDISQDDCKKLCSPPDGGVVPFAFCSVVKLGDGKAVQCSTCVIGRLQEGYTIATREADTATGAYFAIAAELEGASVHAFERLARELDALGAPKSLSARARRAARDEIRHARVMRTFARKHGAEPITPSALEAPLRSLEEIARENAVEGCVRETFGAAVATFQAEHASDPALRDVMTRIAEDETRHAALGWAVAEWANGELDDAAQARIRSAMKGAIAALGDAAGAPVAPALLDVGMPDAATSSRLFGALRETLWS